MDSSLAGRNFHHPFEPYSIQEDFMNAVYDCLEERKVGILESPTGTGKSLSLICGSLTWLRDHQQRSLEDGLAVEVSHDKEPSWVLEHAQRQKRQEALRRKEELNARLAKIRAQEISLKSRHGRVIAGHKRRKVELDTDVDKDDNAQFILDDYDSDQESHKQVRSSPFDDLGLSGATYALMQDLGYSTETKKVLEDSTIDETKIFFCSRTHSQLTQFSSELRRVQMPVGWSPHEGQQEMNQPSAEPVRYITLGSRKNLCINSQVSRLGNAAAINERCLELQQGTKTEARCPYKPSLENDEVLQDFRDHALADIRDIEDLGSIGKKLGICPYYASRTAIKRCEIVTLPYPLLLQKAAREALGLSLRNHVVIIDEAHNLMDAIAGIYSTAVELHQVEQARAQLTVYLQRFRNKLKGKNRVYVAQVIRILDSITSYLRGVHARPGSHEGVVDMVALLSGKGVDQINLYKLNAYLNESRLARKVDGYTAHMEEAAANQTEKEGQSGSSITIPVKSSQRTTPVLMHVQAFLLSLMNPSTEGRFFYAKEDGSGTSLRYMLLDPTYAFRDIVEEARAVVLAGGTMSPMSDYTQHLLPYLHPTSIKMLSCNHVIPATNLIAIPVVQNEDGNDFNFTFENRTKENTLVTLGLTLLTMLRNIPDGVVVFFPSYTYLDLCVATWKRLTLMSSSCTYWDQMSAEKPIFLEQRTQYTLNHTNDTNQTCIAESTLAQYASAIESGKGRGAILLAVVGGSLSEGINFSDALGRGVVIVGLPFPNPHSAEWKTKTQYISGKVKSSGGDGKLAAQDYYENTCMRAVNQCIGRAIRHRNDYAAILMIDNRYGSDRIQAKLPKWIQSSLSGNLSARRLEGRLKEFFDRKRS
ncbi:ATP-dependent DNA helicase chl1 [Coniothyrium glycines]